jgi:FAD binding domain
MRVSQVGIEPALARVVRSAQRVDARWGVAFEDLAQDHTGVTVTLRAEGGGAEQVRCDYLVGRQLPGNPCACSKNRSFHESGIRLIRPTLCMNSTNFISLAGAVV